MLTCCRLLSLLSMLILVFWPDWIHKNCLDTFISIQNVDPNKSHLMGHGSYV